jgi:chromosome segregation ATPase
LTKLNSLWFYQALDDTRAENASLVAHIESVGSQDGALQARVSELEGRLAEMKAALEAARMRLEQQRDITVQNQRTQEAVAVAIESLADRVETVAELLADA